MPYTINGIGTSVHLARGNIQWDSGRSFDGVECLVVVFLPIIPYRAIHTFGWDGTQYRMVPIRWSWGLVFRTFLRAWLIAPLIGSIGCAIAAYDSWQPPSGGPGMTWALIAAGLGMISPVGWWLLWKTDGRTRAIRRVLGPHELGSSDPATWTRDLLDRLADPKEAFGASSYAEAAAREIHLGSPIQAMWAARFCVAIEDRHEGERLTDEILARPGMDEAIERIRKQPQLWPQSILGVV